MSSPWSNTTPFAPEVVTIASGVGPSIGINWSTGPNQNVTITGSGTAVISSASPPPAATKQLVLKIVNTAGVNVILSGFIWPNGVAPIISAIPGAVTVLEFYWDGINYYGSTFVGTISTSRHIWRWERWCCYF